jgi:hypothetical protein
MSIKDKLNKQFVPYQPSLEIRDLGFDEPCFGFYTESKDNVTIDNSGLITNSNFTKIFSETRFRLVTPLWQQAFDFFRKKYGLNSFIQEEVKGKYRFCIEKWEDKKYIGIIYPSYKVAQIKCLNKLIETAKVKKIIFNIEKNKV